MSSSSSTISSVGFVIVRPSQAGSRRTSCLPDFAFDVHTPAVRLNNRATLKQTDAQSLFFVVWNGRNSDSLRNAGVIPQPLSITDSRTRLPWLCVRTWMTPFAPTASRAFRTGS